ncbi:hypothetical protein NP493_257g00010 [Ridgeia piscesae]|uniref:Uncharacterized protein n=1 Tax=Ridgeia piscesae TaxID=27915 RepID=A0AAD9NYA1_RIDPI|nr:hypothetical protein NP493_257g00010 [Ridgeia piscesae]
MSFSLDELEGIVKTSYDEDTLKTDNAVKKTLKKKLEKAKTKEPLLKNAKVSTPTEQPKEVTFKLGTMLKGVDWTQTNDFKKEQTEYCNGVSYIMEHNTTVWRRNQSNAGWVLASTPQCGAATKVMLGGSSPQHHNVAPQPN